MKSRWLKIFLTLALLASLPAFAQGTSKQGYILAPVIQPVKEQKVEVVEFFWYGCAHCNALDPKITAWAKGRNDIVFKRVHAPLAPDWVSMTKAFYTLVQMGKIDEMHTKMFDAMHNKQIYLDDPDVLFKWIEKQGIDIVKFKSVFNSFGTQVKVKQAEQLSANYRLTGVPVIVVDGKFITGEKYAGDNLFKVLDQLVERAKKERKKAK